MAQEPESYEVKDKRRFNPDGTPRNNEDTEHEEEATEQAQTEEAAEETAGTQAQEPEREAQMPPPNVWATMEFMISLLAEQAWILMGLRLGPGQKELVKDIPQAKAAIDTIVFLSDKLHPHQSDPDRAAIRGLVSDLQINFVRLSQ